MTRHHHQAYPRSDVPPARRTGGTPESVIQRANGALRTALASQDVIDGLAVMGLEVASSTPAELTALLKAMSTRPAELLGLSGGTLRPGAPADVIVIDPDVPWVLDRDELKSKCRNTPFDEARLQGRAMRTIVAGRTVYEYV